MIFTFYSLRALTRRVLYIFIFRASTRRFIHIYAPVIRASFIYIHQGGKAHSFHWDTFVWCFLHSWRSHHSETVAILISRLQSFAIWWFHTGASKARPILISYSWALKKRVQYSFEHNSRIHILRDHHYAFHYIHSFLPSIHLHSSPCTALGPESKQLGYSGEYSRDH